MTIVYLEALFFGNYIGARRANNAISRRQIIQIAASGARKIEQ